MLKQQCATSYRGVPCVTSSTSYRAVPCVTSSTSYRAVPCVTSSTSYRAVPCVTSSTSYRAVPCVTSSTSYRAVPCVTSSTSYRGVPCVTSSTSYRAVPCVTSFSSCLYLYLPSSLNTDLKWPVSEKCGSSVHHGQCSWVDLLSGQKCIKKKGGRRLLILIGTIFEKQANTKIWRSAFSIHPEQNDTPVNAVLCCVVT